MKNNAQNKIKTLFLFGVGIVIGGAIYVLFQNDITVIGNQVAVNTGIIDEHEVVPFDLPGGIVEYLDEDSENQSEVTYPVLSSLKAKLEIPRVGISGAILEGTDESLLDKGFWHFPSASPFAQGGNVVIIGHRFLKLPPHKDTFYHLERVKAGDDILLRVGDRTFTYRAREQRIVKTTDTFVLQQTLNAQLTLITCHPLWTSAERLVIIADRVGE